MPVRKQILRFARLLPAAVAAALLPAILLGTGSGCGNGIFSQVTSSATATATPSGTGAFLYASNFNDGKVVAFKRDITSGALTVIGTTTAGSNGVIGLTITPNNGFLYAADSAGNKVYEFRINSNGTLARIGAGSIAAGNTPQMIAVDPTMAWAYVTNLGGGGSVSQYAINASNGTLSANGAVTGFSGQPFGIVAHPAGGFIYVSDNQQGIVYAFQIQSDGTLKQIDAKNSLGTQPGNPGLMVIASDSTAGPFYLFVPDTTNGLVSEFTIATNGQLSFGGVFGTAASTSKPIGIALANNAGGANNYLYTANVNGKFVQWFLRSAANLTPGSSVNALNSPTGLVAVVNSNGSFVYTGESGSATVAELQINGPGSCGTLCFVNRFSTESSSSGGTQFLAITN